MCTAEERLAALEQALLGERAARQQAEARTAQLETRLIDQAQMSQLMRDISALLKQQTENPQLLDTKVWGKPAKFESDRAKWKLY